MRDYITNLLSESDIKHENTRIEVMGNTVDTSLQVIDRDVKSIKQDTRM